MPQQTAVILVVGLNQSLIGDWSPNLARFVKKGKLRKLTPSLPAVTTTVQSSMLTGKPPAEHGIVSNGWYNRELAEVQFWKQSNHLVHGEKVWETARKRDPSVTCLKSFWWYNMYSSADYAITPRPMYKADGRKIPDCYSHPGELRDELQSWFGQFPLFNFWGPTSSIESSRWIGNATLFAHRKYDPTLSLVYLPHLDYSLQKFGPGSPEVRIEVTLIDAIIGEMLDFYDRRGVRPMIVSEYGIEPVDDAVHPNRALRKAGLLNVRIEDGRELLDAGASAAFAVADHQIAHVYINNEKVIPRVKELFEHMTGVGKVLDEEGKRAAGLNHQRSGELVLVASPRRWFTYYYWENDHRAPDFARTVDIHRKPGYDPCELFLDPSTPLIKAKVAWRLFQKKVLQQRALLDVIPLNASIVRGSHGRIDLKDDLKPVLITTGSDSGRPEEIHCTDVRDVILEHLFE